MYLIKDLLVPVAIGRINVQFHTCTISVEHHIMPEMAFNLKAPVVAVWDGQMGEFRLPVSVSGLESSPKIMRGRRVELYLIRCKATRPFKKTALLHAQVRALVHYTALHLLNFAPFHAWIEEYRHDQLVWLDIEFKQASIFIFLFVDAIQLRGSYNPQFIFVLKLFPLDKQRLKKAIAASVICRQTSLHVNIALISSSVLYSTRPTCMASS